MVIVWSSTAVIFHSTVILVELPAASEVTFVVLKTSPLVFPMPSPSLKVTVKLLASIAPRFANVAITYTNIPRYNGYSGEKAISVTAKSVPLTNICV